MKFRYIEFHDSALTLAILQQNEELMKLFLSQPNIDVNVKRTHSLLISGMFHQELKMTRITTPLTRAILKRNKERIELVLVFEDFY